MEKKETQKRRRKDRKQEENVKIKKEKKVN